MLCLPVWAQMTPRQIANQMHNRLTGSPAKADVLMQMETLISQGRAEEAARIALNHRNFINVVVKNWVKPWSNRERSQRVELNDYVATIMGVIRDDLSFDRVLYDDLIYTLNWSYENGTRVPYDSSRNDHYSGAETEGVDIKASLVRQTQSTVTGIPSAATSGVITTGASARAFFSAGTNRRVNRFTFINYLCNDYEDLHDTTIPDYRVRRDVERNPGGDFRRYKNSCVGCHAGQDALGGAYAYYNMAENRLVYTPGIVTDKINKFINFKDGHTTIDDSWINLWVAGANSRLGWKGTTAGNGAKEINRMFARSHAFAQCMARKVYKLVCTKDPQTTEEKNFVEQQALNFETGYNMKSLFAKTTVGCLVK